MLTRCKLHGGRRTLSLLPIRFSLLLLAACPLIVEGSGVPAAKPIDNMETISANLRPLFLEAIPDVLYERADNWGHQDKVVNGLKWKGLKPKLQKGLRNDGHWRKVKVTPRELHRSFDFKLHDLKNAPNDTQTFRVDLALDMTVYFEQQLWESGIRLYSGSTRARLRAKLGLDCESTLKTDYSKGILPDVVLRMRVVNARTSYENLVVEHTAGLGGEGAELLGDVFHRCLKQWKPSIERKLLERANAAVVKAADTKEIRLGLSGFSQSRPVK